MRGDDRVCNETAAKTLREIANGLENGHYTVSTLTDKEELSSNWKGVVKHKRSIHLFVDIPTDEEV